MAKLLLLADDYTGVLDTAVQFSKNGLCVAVTTCLSAAYLEAHKNADVIALSTESRHLSPQDAYAAVYRAAKLGKDAGIPYLYKKTDSTLRGNIGAELEAAMDAYQSEVCAFLPAFVRQGRMTKEGIHYVDGLPLSEAPIAKDPFNPLFTSSVSEILQLQTTKPILNLPAPLDSAIKADSHAGILVMDAQTDAHIETCATWIAQSGVSVMAGCAGLAEHIGEMLFSPGKRPMPSLRCTKALGVCGSLNPVSLRQVAFAQRAGVASVLAPNALKQVPNFLTTLDGEALIQMLRARASSAPVLLLSLAPAQPQLHELSEAGEDAKGRERIIQNAGALTAKLLEEERFDLLIVIGGDTLFGIIRALKNATLTPIAELAPGVALSSLTFGEGRSCTLVSKAGGLGEEDFLPRILARFGLSPR